MRKEAVVRRAIPNPLVWVGLLAIHLAYVACVVSLHPTNYFGLFEDDSIYFSSAKALAQGQGYILPSVPGTPPATKYPILFPLILSLVWKWNPSFPQNLSAAVGITIAFGIAYITAGFFFLRRSGAFNEAETFFLTAFCAVHPLVLFFSGNVLSDIPFAALALAAMVLADKFLKSGNGSGVAAVCGVVAGLSMLMRVFGVAVVAGIILAALARRAWKKIFVFTACVAPFFLVIVWRNVFPPPVTVPVVSGGLGWMRAWAYYTNYIAIWKFGVPNSHIFWAMVRNNLELVVQAPADLFLSPLLVSDTIAGRALVLVVSVLTFAGLARQGLAKGWQAFHSTLPFFVILILCWNYSDAGNRFLLPFYFIFAAGFWTEMKHLLVLLRGAWVTKSGGIPNRVMALALSVGAVALGVGIIYNYACGRRRDVYALSEERGRILKDKREAYDWLRRGSDRDVSPVLGVEDATLYLYSGRQSFSPVIFPTSALYGEAYLNESLNQVMDVARAFKPQYWVFADDDFHMESKEVAAAVKKCLGSSGPAEWPAAFVSTGKRVVVRSIGSVSNGANPCEESRK